jgi:hypothetical protein
MQGNLSSARPDAWKHQVHNNQQQAYLALETEPQSFKETKKLPTSDEWHKVTHKSLPTIMFTKW